MRAHRVRALLMGGQACVFYGAAEFSRDIDFAVLAEAAGRHPRIAAGTAKARPATAVAIDGNLDAIAAELFREEAAERGADREYWQPLIAELAELRRMR